MGTKGVFLLGLIVCWSAVCNGEYESVDDYKIKDKLARLLATDNLILVKSDVGTDCSEETPCDSRQKCDEITKKCVCADGLTGDNCEFCTDEKFKDCKGTNGTCNYDDKKKESSCSCDPDSSKKVHPEENRCRETCEKEDECVNGGKCESKGDHKFCTCEGGLYGDKCEKIFDCEEGKYSECKNSGGTCTYDGTNAKCTCQDPKKLSDTEHICKECTCQGEKEICSFQNGEQQCDCEPGSAKKEGVCTATCKEDTECGDGGKCEEKGDHKFCTCKQGLYGDKCEKIFDCEEGKYKGCKNSGGECTYDGTNAICTCPDLKKLSDTEHICKDCKCNGKNEICSFQKGKQQCDCESGFTRKNGICKATCTKDDDCKKREKCKGEEGPKTCECADGLGGDDCTILNWCKSKGKFENCKGVNGTCKYVEESRTVDCICSSGKILDPSQNRCREACSGSVGCENGGTCMENICHCWNGYIGDRCEIVFDCTDQGKFKGCKGSGGTCRLDGNKAVCHCPVDQKYHDNEHACKECKCESDRICNFVNGEKQCDCPPGFGEKDGICIAICSTNDDCKDNQTCSEPENNLKTCVCARGLSGKFCEKMDWCSSRFRNCKGVNGTCEYSKDKRAVDCTCTSGKELYQKENRCRETCKNDSDCQNSGTCDNHFCLCKLGVIGDKCENALDCAADTGKYKGCEASGGNCTHDGQNVVCKCPVNQIYDNTEHKCKECNCGPNGTCKFENKQKTCDCYKGFGEKNGICTATCSSNANCTENQRCMNQTGWMSCVCADGLSGNNCEKNDWCAKTGKFKDCKGENGTCQYNKEKRFVECFCDSGKDVHPTENRCRETCNADTDCKNGAKCENKFCSCNEGFSGDKCETIFDCTSEGKYKFCESSGGKCSFDGSKTVCTCTDNKKFHDTENICKAKCTNDEQCKNGGWCDTDICYCDPKLTGDICEIVIDCEANGKYRGCRSSGGTCTYENSDAVCTCPSNKKYHETEHKCIPTCSSNADCTENQKCVDEKGWKSCACADGLSGNNCENNDWCTTTGKFKDCKGENGTCQYNKEKRSVECICGSGKDVHPTENRCKGNCSRNADCKNTGTCENNFCRCKVGVYGDKCEIVFDCEPTGKYEGCKDSGGTCSYDGSNAVCSCPDRKKLHDTEHICKDCDCGSKGTCRFENGQKKCDCVSGFGEKGGICIATCNSNTDCKENQKCWEKDGWKSCVCADGLSGDNCEKKLWCDGKFKNCRGVNGTCEYIKDKRAVDCTCPSGKALHSTENRCREQCNNHCQNDGKCEENKFCSCKPGIIGDKCETIFDCSAGKYKNCAGSGGTCSIENNVAVCKCPDHKILHDKEGICKEFCEKDEECNGGQCKEEKGKKICFCKFGLKGDKCQIIKDCVEGKYVGCTSSGGNCTFDGTEAKCLCTGSKLLDTSLNICREKCNDDCKNGGKCNPQKLCKCLTGTSGDKCEKIKDCEVLNCGEKNAECVFDPNNLQPICKCKDKNYYFEQNECKPKWCLNGCSKDSNCEFNNGVGVCKCKTEGTYYDYVNGKCLTIDKCFNKTCGDGEVCNNGNCVCDGNHQLKEKKCEAKDFCGEAIGACFAGAKCEKGTPLGYVKCTCDDKQFYNPNTKKCEDISCFSPKEKKSCNAGCPGEMERKDGVCKHKTDKTACNKECGTLGWCYKTDTSEGCVCEPTVAERDATSGKCVLKASAVCPTIERDGDDKCKCTGKYKPSANGITCELKSCTDQDVKDECRKRRADKCVDNWKGDGYKCVCPFGYIDSKEKGCIDPCSKNDMKSSCLSKGQVCYVGTKNGVGDCRCFPTFTSTSTNTACEPSGKNTVMIHNLPILSKKYESPDKNINKVLLNIDVTNSMQKAFKNLDFVYVYSYKFQDGALSCDIWLQFKTEGLPENFNATFEVRRWKSQTIETNDLRLLPPALFLSSKFKEATEEELTFCSDSVRETICGKGSSCVKNVCSCKDGFQEIDSTIQSYGNKGRVVRCEDIDECKEGTHKCPANSNCVNTAGDYFCRCNAGYKKKEGDAYEMDKKDCIGLCDAKPCGKGECKLTKENNVDCTCPVGYSGSFCNKKDERLAKASQSTKVVGAVLGTLLGIVIILIIVYVVRQRKNAYSEDFTPAPRIDNAEMVERRPMRGVSNRAYQ